MAAPTEGISVDGMLELFQGLHRAGAPIEVMNAFRKRVMRWGPAARSPFRGHRSRR
jgi:glycerate-2-kinase